MANVVNGNSIYVDTTGAISDTDGALVMQLVVTATAASAIVKLKDTTSTSFKGDFRVAVSGESRQFNFAESPMVFPSGITIDTLTNAVATFIIRRRGTGGSN